MSHGRLAKRVSSYFEKQSKGSLTEATSTKKHSDKKTVPSFPRGQRKRLISFTRLFPSVPPGKVARIRLCSSTIYKNTV